MQVEQVSVEALIPHASNARTHPETQVEQIAASITEFGFNNPVLIDDESTIIAGHGRVLAALELGIETVPCIRLSHLSEAQRKAYVIADNKIALNSGWDDQLLALGISELTELGCDLSVLGFTNFELSTLGDAQEVEKSDQEQPKDVNFTIQFNIIFDAEEQQDDWYRFVKHLKEQYPEAETLGERLQCFILEGGYGAD